MNISDLILKKLTGQTSSGGGGGTTTPIGESSTSAYRGDRGKIAYDHSQQTGGNPHNITKEQVGLGNVNNTSDINKPISAATASALSNKLNTDGITIVKYAGSGDISSSYKLMVSGVQRGESIDIVKSLLVSDAELLTCSQDGVPSPDFIVGDKYLDFVVNVAGGTGVRHLYIKLTDLVDIYVGSNSILIDDNNIVSLKLDPSSKGLSITAGGLKLPLATDTLDGAMSSTDKIYIDNLKNIGMDPPSMNQITDTNITSLSTNDFLKFNGTKWVNIKPNIASGPVMLDSLGKIPSSLGGGIDKLANMTDVAITNIKANQVLTFNGTTWVNANPQGGSSGATPIGETSIFKSLFLLNASSWVACTEDEPYQFKQIVTVTGCYDTDFALIDLKRTQNTIAGYQDEMNASFLITDFECEANAVTAYVFGDTPPQVDLTYRLLIIE